MSEDKRRNPHRSSSRQPGRSYGRRPTLEAPKDRRYVATTVLGLERVLGDELYELGARDIQKRRGVVAFRGDRTLMMNACLWLRTAHRVLWTLAEGRARDAEELYQFVAERIRWGGLIGPGQTISISGSAINSETLRDGRFVALKAKDAICDVLREARGSRPDVDRDDPDIRITVRVSGDRITVSLDAAGQSLHARGYRAEHGAAPLRETLAAGALALLGWDGDVPLVDPMCGSGTFPIEAGLVATNRAPGSLGRRFGFERWPGHKEKRWQALLEAADASTVPAEHPIAGSDVSGKMVRIAQDNAVRAGLESIVKFRHRDARDLEPPRDAKIPGIVVANPPYGHRLSGEEAYVALGRALRSRFAGWEGGVIAAEETHERALNMQIATHFNLLQGALDVVLLKTAVSADTGGD